MPDKPGTFSFFARGDPSSACLQLRHESAADSLCRIVSDHFSWDLDETMFASPQFWEPKNVLKALFRHSSRPSDSKRCKMDVIFLSLKNVSLLGAPMNGKEEKKEEYYKGKEVKGKTEKKKEYYKGEEVKGEK